MTRRFLLVHRYFDPDVTTYAQMLAIFGDHLSQRGHTVTAFAGFPSYNGAYQGEKPPGRDRRASGMRVVRVAVPSAVTTLGKAAGNLVFPLRVLLHLVIFGGRYDVVSVTTTPPVLMGLVARIASRVRPRVRFVYHCMDLYPEVAVALDADAPDWLTSVAARVDAGTCSAADLVIVLSGDMRSTVQARGVNARLAVANNFVLAELPDCPRTEPTPVVAELKPQRHLAGEPAMTRFVFAGNLGRFQGLETLVAAARLVASRRSDFELVFMGAGPLRRWIEQQARECSALSVAPFLPIEDAVEAVSGFDHGVVSLGPGVIGAAYPSKLATYLEAGVSVLAIVEPESEMASALTERAVGKVVQPGDPIACAAAIEEVIDRPNPDRESVRAVGRELFGRDQGIERWTELYERVAS